MHLSVETISPKNHLHPVGMQPQRNRETHSYGMRFCYLGSFFYREMHSYGMLTTRHSSLVLSELSIVGRSTDIGTFRAGYTKSSSDYTKSFAYFPTFSPDFLRFCSTQMTQRIRSCADQSIHRWLVARNSNTSHSPLATSHSDLRASVESASSACYKTSPRSRMFRPTTTPTPRKKMHMNEKTTDSIAKATLFATLCCAQNMPSLFLQNATPR